MGQRPGRLDPAEFYAAIGATGDATGVDFDVDDSGDASADDSAGVRPAVSRRAAAALGLVAIALLVLVVSWVRGPSTDQPGTPLSELEIGACARVAGLPDGPIDAVPTVACDEPHDAEAFHIGESNPSGDRVYPGDEAAHLEAANTCVGPAFTTYVGSPYETSELDVVTIFSPESHWSSDRGRFICIAYAPTGTELVGSVQGSGR